MIRQETQEVKRLRAQVVCELTMLQPGAVVVLKGTTVHVRKRIALRRVGGRYENAGVVYDVFLPGYGIQRDVDVFEVADWAEALQ